MKDKPTIFVTGGTGLIGAHLLLQLAQQGHAVRALRRRGSNTDRVKKIFAIYHPDPDALWQRIEWHTGDLLDTPGLHLALEGVRQVYHCAAVVSMDSRSAGSMQAANIDGTANILAACLAAGTEKLCYVSSSSALGKTTGGNDPFVRETTPWDHQAALSDYAASKYAAEQAVWEAIACGLKAVIVNPTIVLGPGDWDRSSARMIKTVWKGFPFYSSGVNGFVDVRDVVEAMIRLTEGPFHGERYILNSENLPFAEVFGLIANGLGRRRPFIPTPPLLGTIAWRGNALLSSILGTEPTITRATVMASRSRHYFSNEKVRNALGMDFRPVAAAVRDTCAIFRRELGELGI
jgi:dihydroflavonol-4-reductase